jgi:hypothetical protein
MKPTEANTTGVESYDHGSWPGSPSTTRPGKR